MLERFLRDAPSRSRNGEAAVFFAGAGISVLVGYAWDVLAAFAPAEVVSRLRDTGYAVPLFRMYAVESRDPASIGAYWGLQIWLMPLWLCYFAIWPKVDSHRPTLVADNFGRSWPAWLLVTSTFIYLGMFPTFGPGKPSLEYLVFAFGGHSPLTRGILAYLLTLVVGFCVLVPTVYVATRFRPVIPPEE